MLGARYDLVEGVEVFHLADGKEALLTKVRAPVGALFAAKRLTPPQADVYVGHVTNPSFSGPMPLPELAAHIHKSVGPSGPNKVCLLTTV